MTVKKLTFKKRIPEPKEMGKEEMKVFEKMSIDSFRRWIIPLADDAVSRVLVKNGKILVILFLVTDIIYHALGLTKKFIM